MAVKSLATAFVNLVPGTKDFEATVKRDLSDKMDGVGAEGGKRLGDGMLGAVKRFAAPIAAAIGTVAIGQFVADSIRAASDLSESQNAVKVSFGAASEAVARLGQDAATRLGLSQSAFNGIAVQFSAFAETIAGQGGNVSAVIDELSTRGADFASVMNLEVSDALALFQSGLAGETEPLRRYGIDLSAAAVEAYAMANGIGESGRELTEAEKVQARYGSLLEQTNKVAGDFANTSDGLANSQRIANARLEDARASLGNSLLPIMATVTQFAADTFVPIIEGIGQAFQWMADNLNIVIPVLAGLGTVILIAIAPALWAAVAATWAWTAALLANPITWIVLAVAALIAAVVALVMNWETVVAWINDVFGPVFEWLGGIFTWLWETIIKPVVDAIAMAWTWLYENIIAPIITGIQLYIAIWGAIIQWLYDYVIKPVFDAIGVVFEWIWNSIIKPIIDWIVLAVQAWGLIFDWLYNNAIKPAFDAIGKVFDWIWNNVIKPTFEWVAGAVETVGGVFEDIFGGVADFIESTFKSIVGFVKAPINAIIDIINNMISGLNGLRIDIPDWVPGEFGGKTIGFNIPRIPKLAKGGYVDSSTLAVIGEAGPEVVTPLKDFERMMGLDNGNGKTVNYYAAPNQSIDSEQALFTALKRAKVLAAW